MLKYGAKLSGVPLSEIQENIEATMYHENGKASMRIDEELKGEVQTELMKAMLRFQLKGK